MITVSIIGTAGRNELYKRLSPEMYDRACASVSSMLSQIASAHDTTVDSILIKSGGAALSDHISVTLFLTKIVSKIHLHLPCDFRGAGPSPHFESRSASVADSANRHHHNFSQQININSLAELSDALSLEGASFDVSSGFSTRNSKIAKCDYLIGLTFPQSGTRDIVLSQTPPFQESSIIPTGGTGNTWRQAISAGRILLALL